MMKMTNRISSFPPIVAKTSRVLILGSVPGVRSLEAQEYYAHPQNQFWKIIFQLLEEEWTADYDRKTGLLAQNGIAVWDVIDTCERQGSLDTAIRNEEHNDIVQLLNDFPGIEAIFCNGQKAHKNLLRIVGKNFEIPLFVMPSTSPLHTIALEKKLEAWKSIKSFL